jgi:hypothetical protein
MVAPPSELIFPPPDAVDAVIELNATVVRTGKVAAGPKGLLSELISF